MHLYHKVKGLYFKFIAPLSNNEDDIRREFILNILLLGSIFLVFVAIIKLSFDCISDHLKGDLYDGLPLWSIFFIFTFFLFFYYLSRKGFFILASYLLIIFLFIPTTYGVYNWGFDLQAPLLVYALLIVMSGILISKRTAFIVSVTICIIIIFLAYLRDIGTLTTKMEWHEVPFTLADAIVFVVILSIITLVSWLSNREIEKSLKRARKSEKALKIERDSLEIKVRERTKQLKKAEQEKIAQIEHFAEFGRLASGIFHDIASPLTAISLSLNQVKKPEAFHIKKVNEHLNRAVSATKQIQHLLNSAQKNIKLNSDAIRFSLNKEIKQVMEMTGYRLKREHISITFSTAENIYYYGDPLKFYQVASNLIINAIDSYIRIITPKKKRIIIKLGKRDNCIIFSVRDFGCGIKPNIIRKIFDPLFTSKNAKEGSGIGLATTKTIVEKTLKGKIKVKSLVGKGSKFSVCFPEKYPHL